MKRYIAATLFVALVLGLIGCNSFPPWKNNNVPSDKGVDNGAFKRDPTAADLVAIVNANSQRVQGVQSTQVAMDCKQGDQIPIGVDAMLACQKPRQFRLKGKVGGTDQVDIGSNDEEFWYWVGKADPHVFHCSYKDMASGQVALPFPFNPDVVVSALNIANYDPNAHYEVRKFKDEIHLIEPTKSLQGHDIFKVTVFNRGEVTPNKPRVLAYVLKDKQGKDICKADILETQVNKETGAVLPKRVKIIFFGPKPSEDSEMKMTFSDLKPMAFPPERAAVLFSRSDLGNLQGYDLARRAPDRPTGMTESNIRQAGGVNR